MTDEQERPAPAAVPLPPAEAPAGRFADLDLLQDEVAKRIRDNQRFLDHLLDDDYSDEEDAPDVEPDPADFEEL